MVLCQNLSVTAQKVFYGVTRYNGGLGHDAGQLKRRFYMRMKKEGLFEALLLACLDLVA